MQLVTNALQLAQLLAKACDENGLAAETVTRMGGDAYFGVTLGDDRELMVSIEPVGGEED